ncbi:hypothetical protein BGX28_002400 [Mortierella sp. GBA30]|nr:hypothetical protein BGX28_002400 [Mortierella sp. GBA30]
MAVEQVEAEAGVQRQDQHNNDLADVQLKTASAKRAALVPLIASTLSPVTSPAASPTSPSSPSFASLLHHSRPLSPRSPFSIVPVTSSSLSSLSSSSSSSSTISTTSFSSLPSSSNSHHHQTLSHLTADTDSVHLKRDMTVAKLDPSAGGASGPVSPTAAFSPPASLHSEQKGIYSTTTATTTTTTTTTTTIADTKTSSSTNSSTTTLRDDSKSAEAETETDKNKEKVKDDRKSSPQPRRLGPKMNPIYKGLRALVWALYFNLGASLISMTQVLSLPLALIAPGVYRRHINRTEGHFGAFLLKMNQLFAPSDIVLTGDESVRGIVKVYQGRRLKHDGKKEEEKENSAKGDDILLDMPERMIFISNHQIYSDWMYLWCFSYFAEKHRALKIILRGDLTWIPGMRFFDFIFLKRNDWVHDKRAIEENLDRVNEKEPLWLVVFPEGTVVSKETRQRSVAFAKKAGLTDHRHVLLPRTSGLLVCINKLRGSVEYLYDATVGYSGIEYGEIPQELYPLPGLYVNQAQPKEINMHLRRFAIKDIPTDEPEFVEWVRTRWQEKDDLLEEFYTKGRFPSQLTAEDIGGQADDDERSSDINKEEDGLSIRIPLKSRATLDYLSPSALNVLALPVLAFAIRYALQQSS